ncbi:hypothetical protein BC937DRAFT_86583 [Endogone sp. FLAS-F59071]|nr:hypothetical protein BC937DRAFT_86583 [Endogone sp. FLAS-F59071]|eukprot:RUS19999.1 hypothetical protein BC937DRAFT_86583 [Endogone sp. FLAS-F59071]
MVTGGADEEGHVLNNAKDLGLGSKQPQRWKSYRHVHFCEHVGALLRVDQRDVLRGGDDNDAYIFKPNHI